MGQCWQVVCGYQGERGKSFRDVMAMSRGLGWFIGGGHGGGLSTIGRPIFLPPPRPLHCRMDGRSPSHPHSYDLDYEVCTLGCTLGAESGTQ